MEKEKSFSDMVDLFREHNDKWRHIERLPYYQQLGARIRKVNELSKEDAYKLLEDVRIFMVSDAAWEEKYSLLPISRILLDHIKDEYGVEEKLKIKR